MDDLISRQKAINVLKNVDCSDGVGISALKCDVVDDAVIAINEPPSAESIILDDGTLTITVQHGMLSKVNRIIVDEVGTKFCKMMYQDALPSAQPEPLTDKEKRIFLAAMGREENVCKQVDEECGDCCEPYEDSLVSVCREIKRKVKGVLWT